MPPGVFEGLVAIALVVIPAWSAWSARRSAAATLVAAAKLKEESDAREAAAIIGRKEAAAATLRVAEIAERSRKEVAAAANTVADVAERSRNEVAAAANTVAEVAKETSAHVATTAEKTLAKLETLATSAQVDGAIDRMLEQINKRIEDAYKRGLAEGQKQSVDDAVQRIESGLAKSREVRLPDARTRKDDHLASATAETVDAAHRADDIANDKDGNK